MKRIPASAQCAGRKRVTGAEIERHGIRTPNGEMPSYVAIQGSG
jgi:hypothetical protein